MNDQPISEEKTLPSQIQDGGEHFDDVRDEYIAQVVRGRKFCEVGGLWGIVNEKASVAHRHGATELTMIDVQKEGHDLWVAFHQRMEQMGIKDVQCISASIADEPQCRRWAGAFDCVHCSGVLYHLPNPLAGLRILKSLATEYLILNSAITQQRIENEHGVYEVPPSGTIFVPALDRREKRILGAYWQREAGVQQALGITDDCEFNIEDYSPWWFLPTAHCLKSMCTACGMVVEDSRLTWNNNALTLKLRC